MEVSLSLLEEHCQHLESVKQNTTLVMEHHLPVLHQRSVEMRPFYRMVDRMEAAVREISATTDRMERELTLAENMFSVTSFRVPKVLSSLLPSRKKTSVATLVKYNAPVIFETKKLFSRVECELGAEACEDDDCPPTLFTTADH